MSINAQNLFDTIDDPGKDDTAFLPIELKKYKVKITRDTIVEAQNEDEAKEMAVDSLNFGDVDFEVEEYEEN